ncbi:TRAP transporter small permease [Garciella nitratireducens]|uniref:TRAP-type C4-dicarboxylate transport system, small permease component n=1 Tax=Garciella nitratireducens DSM 15102 TaxID=1121911 RepID=A0A1T4P3H2_9FIRM|nr:TRAP transporter small permease [Garciella nitratireducens]SJZ86073.1 TRAP-type C4-dicarboxylate transport system, small permease component [Garciella nitratireducens DSM 15102]
MHKSLRKILDKTLRTLCVVLFAFMTVLATYQVVTRYFFYRPSTISEELLTYSFAWMSLLVAAYVFGKQDHMRMTFIVEKFSKENQRKFVITREIITLIFAIVILIYGGFSIAQLGMGQQSSSLGIPMGYVYLVLPVSGIITMIYNILNLRDLIQEK